MKITYYGQNCFLIETKGVKILTDPALSVNPLAKNHSIDDLSADYLLLTHAHGDHIADAEQFLNNTDATVISNYEVVTHYQNKEFKGHPMNHGGKWDFDFGTIKMVNAVHSSVFPDGSYGGNPCGFVLWNDEACIYMAGDTALHYDMKLIPMTCPKLDLAILPIGDNFTMGYEDALIASDFVECSRVVGCHFDSFPYIEINHDKVKKAFQDKGKNIILPNIGKTIEL